jgi:hypothetical protein
MASDGNGVLAITGNRLADGATHQDSEEVLRVTGLGTVDRTTGIYYPTSWRSMDTADADFGASSPVVLQLAGSTPSKVVGAVSKSGHLYLLNPSNLGGMGGHIQDLTVASGNVIRSTPAAYASSTGVHIVFNTYSGASCGQGVVSVLVAPGSPPQAQLAWCAPTGGKSSPIATSTNGISETVVWFMNGSALNGVDGDTGAPIYAGGTCSGVQLWSSPIAVKGRIVAGGDGHLCSWSPH